MLGRLKRLVPASLRGPLTALCCAVLFSACASEEAPTELGCATPLAVLLQSSPDAPLATQPHGVAPSVYPDPTRPGIEGLVVDPHPLSRGAHPVYRYWQDPQSCEAVGGSYAWGPAPPPEDGVEPAAHLPCPLHTLPRHIPFPRNEKRRVDPLPPINPPP